MGYERICIEEIATEYGVNNLRFFIPMQQIRGLHSIGLPIGITCSDDPEVIQECIVDERRYKVADGYKIELRAIAGVDDPDNYFGSKTFYIMDFESLMKRAPDSFRLFVLVDEDDKYKRILPTFMPGY